MNSVTLTFTQEQLAVLSEAVVALPYRVAAPLVADINSQIAAQQPKPEEQTDA